MSRSGSRQLLENLEQAGRLITVARQVAPARDLAAVGWSVFHQLGKVALFQKIEGRPGWCAVTHALADRRQWAMAFSSSEVELPETELLGTLRQRAGAALPPLHVASDEAPACAVRDENGADTVPFVLQAEKDPHPQIVAVALVHDRVTGSDRVGLVRLARTASGDLTVFDLPPGLSTIRDRDAQDGHRVPVALAIGADPALYLAGAFALARPNADVALAGGLAGRPLRVADISGTTIPADAECVVIGHLSRTTDRPSVRASSALGTYNTSQSAWHVHDPIMLRRADPIHWSVDAAGTIALATELLVWNHIQNIEGGLDILDLRCFPCAAGLVGVVKLRPRVQGQAKTALLGSLTSAAYWLKLVVGVDEDVDASSLRDVFWSIASRTHAERDVGMLDGVRMCPDDPSSEPAGEEWPGERLGTRWFVDSTMPAVSQGDQRAAFERAVPRNLANVHLPDDLPMPPRQGVEHARFQEPA